MVVPFIVIVIQEYTVACGMFKHANTLYTCERFPASKTRTNEKQLTKIVNKNG